MIKSEKIAKQINKHLITQLKDKPKLVVAIDGYAGTGKTTIANQLGAINKDILVVHLDDFIKHWKVRRKLILNTKTKSKVLEFEWYRYSAITGLIREFKKCYRGVSEQKIYDFQKNDFRISAKKYSLSKKVLVIDGIFLLHPKHKMNQLFDFTIYLDADIDRADRRRVARERTEFGDKFLPDNHPDNWFRYFQQAYLGYVKKYKPKTNADLVFLV